MENERKSVFERLGPIRPSSSESSGHLLSNSAQANKSKRDMRYVNVTHLSQKRRYQQTKSSQSIWNNNNQYRPVNDQTMSMTTKPKTFRRRRKKQRAEIDREALDEGEIVDDDDDYDEEEEYEDEEYELGEVEEGELVKKTEDSTSNVNSIVKLPEGDNISLTSLSDQEVANNKNKDDQSINDISKSEQNDDKDSDEKKQEDLVESDYSDWSDDDDELLQKNQDNKLESQNNGVKTEPFLEDKPRVFSEPDEDIINGNETNNSFDCSKSKNIEDLETISDGELDDFNLNDKMNSLNEMDLSFNNKNGISNGTSIVQPKVLDILDIDWKSLIENSNTNSEKDDKSQSNKRAQNHEEYRKRNSTIALLNRIGFSRKLAGIELSSYIEQQLNEQLNDHYIPMYNPLPSLHCYYREQQRKRESYFANNLSSNQMATITNQNSRHSPLNGAKIRAFIKMFEKN